MRWLSSVSCKKQRRFIFMSFVLNLHRTLWFSLSLFIYSSMLWMITISSRLLFLLLSSTRNFPQTPFEPLTYLVNRFYSTFSLFFILSISLFLYFFKHRFFFQMSLFLLYMRTIRYVFVPIRFFSICSKFQGIEVLVSPLDLSVAGFLYLNSIFASGIIRTS